MNRYNLSTPRTRPMAGQVWKQTFGLKDSYSLVLEHLDHWSVFYIDPQGRMDTRQFCMIETKILLTHYERLLP